MLAMGAWVNLRGRRYQVLEEEFIAFVLMPHDEALRRSYGMGSKAIAVELQAMADSTRVGMGPRSGVVSRATKAIR